MPQTLKPEQKELFKQIMTADINMLRVKLRDPRMMERAEITYKNILEHMLAADRWSQKVENFKQQFRDNQRSELCSSCWSVDDHVGIWCKFKC